MSAFRKLSPFVFAALVAACGGVDSPGGWSEAGAGPELSWAEFRRMTFREPGTGTFIWNGDTVARDEKELRLVWEQHFAGPQNGLIVHQVNGTDSKWDEQRKKNLTYCVSKTFGTSYDTVVSEMKAATEGWEAVADVDFKHVEAEDERCDATNEAVLFDVNPAGGYVSYLARAFFPDYGRSERNVLIASSAIGRSDIPLVGVLRHELGHTLGFRHEHTRPESGTCFEDSNWRPLTPYDATSVMHYPQCNGRNTWQLPITEDDAAGAANLYGAAGGGTRPEPGNPGHPTDRTPAFTGSLQKGKRAKHGPLAVVGGRDISFGFEAGTGAKMYVRFGGRPTTGTYDVLLAPADTKALKVPGNRRVAYVLVVAADATDYDVFVTMGESTQPAPSTPPAGPTVRRFEGSVAQGQVVVPGSVALRTGARVTVELTGSGDPDLRVASDRNFGAASILCSANASGADTCTFTAPEAATQAWFEVRGYDSTTFALKVTVE